MKESKEKYKLFVLQSDVNQPQTLKIVAPSVKH